MMYKIYKIVDNTNGNVYIGQTNNKYLCNRIAKHRFTFLNNKDTCSSILILCNNNWCYELIEDNLNKEEASIKEKYYIQNTDNCINHLKYNYNPNEKAKKWYRENTDRKSKYDKIRSHYKNSWGGDPRYENNLLKIDFNLFNTI